MDLVNRKFENEVNVYSDEKMTDFDGHRGWTMINCSSVLKIKVHINHIHKKVLPFLNSGRYLFRSIERSKVDFDINL